MNDHAIVVSNVWFAAAVITRDDSGWQWWCMALGFLWLVLDLLEARR